MRRCGISTEIYPDADKMKKQMGYADSKKIPYVALVGENEIAAGKITVKNMTTGAQQMLTVSELADFLK